MVGAWLRYVGSLPFILTRDATQIRLPRFIGSAIDGQGSTAQ
jgi:hypothetical protein